MRTLRIIWIISFALILSCENEMQERNYPRVATNPVSGISKNGAVFSGTITGDVTQIVDHGFAWSTQENPSVVSDNAVKLGPVSDNVFQKEITFSLDVSITYYVRAYVSTSNKTIYGPAEKFVSLGSLGPVFVKMNKTEGQYLDTLELTVRHASGQASKNQVIFIGNNGQAEGSVISVKDSIIRVTVPFLTTENNTVKVTVGKSVTSDLPFKYFLPIIESVTPTEVLFCDTITIKSKYFPRDTTRITLKFGFTEASYVKKGPNIFKHPVRSTYPSAHPITFTMKGYQVTTEKDFIQPEPKITSPPLNADLGQTITITGENLPICDLKVTYPDFPYKQLTVLKSTRTEIQVALLKENYCERPTTLKISPAPSGSVDLVWPSPVINKDNVYSGRIGESVTIKGSGFGTNVNQVGLSIGFGSAKITSLKDDEIIAVIANPSEAGLGTELDIIVGTCEQTTTFEKGFKLLPAIITDFNPKVITDPGTLLEVTGSGFDMNGYNWMGDTELYKNFSFEATSKRLLIPMSTFLKSYGSLHGDVDVKVTTGGRNGVFTTAPIQLRIDYESAWTHKKVFSGVSYQALVTNTSSHGYFGFGQVPVGKYSDKIFEYDHVTDIWTEKAPLPGGQRERTVMVGTNDKLYAGLGRVFPAGDKKDWWEFDRIDNAWTPKADYPGPTRYYYLSFNLNGKIYMGGGYNSGNPSEFYAYDPASDSWTSRAPVPHVGLDPRTFFVFQGKAYFYARNGSTDSEYMYDPITDTWTARIFQGDIYYDIYPGNVVFDNFVLSAKPGGYYKFVPGTNTAEYLPQTEIPQKTFIGFVIDNIAYLGMPYQNGYSGYDIWSFDPFK